MDARKRLIFIIDHMNTPFKEEIKRDLEEALKDARVDELENATIVGREIYHYNKEGNTLSSREARLKRLREKQ